MTLEEAIKKLAKDNVDDTNDWYSWREINENKLPSGIQLPEGNQYRKNLALKIQLNKKLQSIATHDERKTIFKYYISTWGGIHGNSEATLNTYTQSTAKQLVAKGSSGIASWSKALCILQPSDFAIFDARVSASINALQIINKTKNAKLYPVLTSRNNTIKRGINLIKVRAKNEAWSIASECEFYTAYLSHLKNTVSEFEENLAVSVATIEMLLFAKAEELVRQAFPNEHF